MRLGGRLRRARIGRDRLVSDLVQERELRLRVRHNRLGPWRRGLIDLRGGLSHHLDHLDVFDFLDILDDLKPAELGGQIEDVFLLEFGIDRGACAGAALEPLPFSTRAMSLMISSSASPSALQTLLVGLALRSRALTSRTRLVIRDNPADGG